MTLTDHDPTEVLPRLCDRCGAQLTMRDLARGHGACDPLLLPGSKRPPLTPSERRALLACLALIAGSFLLAWLVP